MTAPEIIGDAEAREIARGLRGGWCSVARFLETGETVRGLDGDDLRFAIDQHIRHHGDRDGVLARLRAYVAFHGERGPQPDWSKAGGENPPCCGLFLSTGECCSGGRG